MPSVPAAIVGKGRPQGGPRCFATLLLTLTLALGACGGRSTPGPDGEPRPGGREQAFSRPLEIYRDLGFITGPTQFPAVIGFNTLAGPGDSTLVLVSLSVPNSALRFQRDGANGFFAEYVLGVEFMDADSVKQRQMDARELVRINSFAETGRTEESVIFQQPVAVAPGRYIVRLRAADAHSSRGFVALDTLTVPAYDTRSIAEPVVVYRAAGRGQRDSLPQLIANPRNTVAYGGESPLLYVETYGEQTPLQLRVLDEDGDTLWHARATLQQGNGVNYGVVEIPAAQLPIGRLWVEVAPDGMTASRTPLVLAISDQWMVANFEEVLQFLRFIAFPEELDSLATGTAPERRDAWERFWARRDPLPVTPLNEYRDAFFQRVRYATDAFREAGGRPGWNTDRGEVFIVLGAPDHMIERYMAEVRATSDPDAEEWIYNNVPGGRLSLLFHDRSGFGRYELVPSSQSAFRVLAERLKRTRQQ